MFDKERELVEIGSRFYNLKPGGEGGWDYVNDGSITHRERCSRAGKRGGPISGRMAYNQGFGLFARSKEERMTHSLKAVECLKEQRPDHYKVIQEKARSPEAIQKRKDTMFRNNHSQGSNNSQYGTMWITDGQKNCKIKKDSPIQEGWAKGRTLRKE